MVLPDDQRAQAAAGHENRLLIGPMMALAWRDASQKFRGVDSETSAMPYNEKLAERTREALRERDDVSEQKMFGGLAFMVAGHMCVGIVENELMVRVGPHVYEAALAEAHTRPMDFTGRPLRGMVYVGAAGLRSEAALSAWIRRGLGFVSTLPPKASGATEGRPRRMK